MLVLSVQSSSSASSDSFGLSIETGVDGILYDWSAHWPRSINLQRSLQNGLEGFSLE